MKFHEAFTLHLDFDGKQISGTTAMHCKRAKTEIALWVGNDLDAASIGRLQRHLATCPGCRDHWHGMTSSLRALHDSSDSLLNEPPPGERRRCSVWSAVSVRLASPGFQGSAGRFNGWVPAIAVAAIFLAMVTIANTARITPMSIDPRVVPAETIVFPTEPGSDRGVRFVTDPAPFDSFGGGTRPGVSRAAGDRSGPSGRSEFGGDDAWKSPFPLR